MKRRHITVLTIPFQAHIYPILGLCSELHGRGFRVTCAVADFQAQLLAGCGAEPLFYSIPDTDTGPIAESAPDFLSAPPTADRWWTMLTDGYYRFLLRLADHTLPKLRDFYQTNRPDLILYDPSFYSAPIIADLLHSPAVQLNPHFAYQQPFANWKEGKPDNPVQLIEFSSKIDAFLLAHGIQQNGALWQVEKRNIVLVPKVFQYRAELFDERYCFVGRCLRRPFKPGWRDRSNGKPIILVSDATGIGNPAYFLKIIDALSSSECHVILSVDRSTPDSAFGVLPKNFELNREFSHLEIFPKAALLICQGGLGGTLEAIYHGVPVIALPLHPVHEQVSHRASELGLGRTLSRYASNVPEIRTNVEEMLADASLRKRVKDMRDVLRQEPPAAFTAADRVVEWLDLST